MPNGKEMLNEMEFTQRIKKMPDRELSEFTALQVWEACSTLQNHDTRLLKVEKRSRRIVGWIGTAGVLIGAIVVGVIDYFIRR